MPVEDLRSFLDILKDEHEYASVPTEVDWKHEIGAIMRRVFDEEGPAVLFENITDYPNGRLVGGVLGTFRRYAMAMDLPEGERDIRNCIRKLIRAAENPIEPCVVDSGSCKEEIQLGNKIDAEKFPVPLWHPKDGGRYIGTLGCVVLKDPETGIRNVGIYRIAVRSKSQISLNATQQSSIIMEKYLSRKQAMPVAVAIGVDPLTLIASVISAPYGQDEFGISGGLMNKPLNLVKCETVDLEVPAASEIVLEGVMPYDKREWADEGPFGEFAGYYGLITLRPTVNLTAITHRHNPILQGTLEGRPPNESTTMRAIGNSAGMQRRLDLMKIPGFKEIYMTDMGCCNFIAVASIDRHYFKGDSRQLIRAIQSVRTVRATKWVIIVDDDINIFDKGQVEWALATRVQPHRDIEISEQVYPGFDLDPSIEPDKRMYPNTITSLIGIDATTYSKGFQFGELAEPTKEALEMVKHKWPQYGIELPKERSSSQKGSLV